MLTNSGERISVATLLLRVGALAASGSAMVAPRLWLTSLLAIGLSLALLSIIPVAGRRIVAVSMLGLAFGSGAIMLFSTGVMQAPLLAEFGWSRSEFFFAVQLTAPISVIAAPLSGWLIDRYGVRPVVLISMAALAAVLFSLGALTSGLFSFYLLFVLIPLLGAGASAVAYARLVTGWFDRHRGLALGTALAGMGVGGAVMAPLVQFVVTTEGWRAGYFALGALLLLCVWPLTAWGIRDAPAAAIDNASTARLSATKTTHTTAAPIGFTARESRRQPAFWLMISAFALLGLGIGGLLYQTVPVLLESGISATDAAAIAGATGLSLIAGRAMAGWLMDRFFAPRVAFCFALLPVIGAVLLANDFSAAGAVLAVILIGLAAGAEVDVLAFFIGKYFGTRHFGFTFGWVYAAWSTGAAFGPSIAATLFDRFGVYSIGLWTYAALVFTAAALLPWLPPYPELPRCDARIPGASAVVVDRTGMRL